jgi:transducin (beta)-like 1
LPKNREVSALNWSRDGAYVATGCYDGVARIFTSSGELLQTLNRHRAPVFAVQWNKKGDSLLTGSADKSAIIWDSATGAVKQVFEFHLGPVLDLDWRNDTSFASCSTDKTILVCRLGELQPVAAFKGHTEEVNSIRWDPTGTLLASASDDCSARVWRLDSPDTPQSHFTDHKREIYTLRWSPTGPGSSNPSLPLVLATASFDCTVRVYDVVVNVCLYILSLHTEPVYSVAFSPNGEYLATGGLDHVVALWHCSDGSLAASHKAASGIYEVSWNAFGNKIAACCQDASLLVTDFKTAKMK